MLTSVLNEPTNLGPTEEAEQQRLQSQPAKERPASSRLLFAQQAPSYPSTNMLPMPKTLTASLAVFVDRWEIFQLIEDLFSNNIMMKPNLTETQKKYLHLLRKRNALQTYCHLEESKKR